MHEIADFAKRDAAIEKFQQLSADIESNQKALQKLETVTTADKVLEEVRYFFNHSRSVMGIDTSEDDRNGKTTGLDDSMSLSVHSNESNES